MKNEPSADPLAARVLTRAASLRDEITDLTRRLVAIPTENPPGGANPMSSRTSVTAARQGG